MFNVPTASAEERSKAISASQNIISFINGMKTGTDPALCPTVWNNVVKFMDATDNGAAPNINAEFLYYLIEDEFANAASRALARRVIASAPQGALQEPPHYRPERLDRLD